LYKSSKNKAELIFVSPRLKTEKTGSKRSAHYNQYTENSALKTSFEGPGFISVISVISTNPSDAFEPVITEKTRLSQASEGQRLTIM
jgi:hypothetical protein